MATGTTNGTSIWTNNCPKSLKKNGELSDLAKIEIKSDDPMDLFTEWYQEAIKYSTGKPDAACLATVSKDYKVSARHLIIRHYDERGFVIVTDNRSKKSRDLAEVPRASMCILWAYCNDRQQKISRQARMDGIIERLKPEEFRWLYDREPLFCKIRSHLCHQGEEVNWENRKNRHDEMLKDATAGKIDLSMPDHFIGYRLVPETIEYYYAYDHLIADRLLFIKENGKWTNKRIAA